jgi:catechol 2,3-dioxygenase-like lactoylglutathione lyase family enzyme
MVVQSPVRVHSLHHGAIPVADVGRSYRFYSQLFGARLARILNASVPALQRGFPEIALLDMSGCSAFGLALQYDAIPTSRGPDDGTTWGLETSPDEVDRLAAELDKRGVKSTRPAVSLPSECPVERSLAFRDPDGNGWEIVVRRASPGEAPTRAALRYVSLEVTDLEQAERFYADMLGLARLAGGHQERVLSVGDGDRYVVLRRVEQMSPRAALMKGPHVAFEVDGASFDAAYASLPAREQYWERETNRVPWQEPWRAGYFYDPSYNRLALVAL